MDTQLVTLAPPYNIIFDVEKGFALHIATLIVVDEVKETKDGKTSTKLRSRNYPVVSRAFELEGEAWTDYELKYYHKVCREGETISLRPLRLFMEECELRGGDKPLNIYPMQFNIAMMSFGVTMNLEDPFNTGKIKSDYEVKLVFDDTKGAVRKYSDFVPAYIDDGICEVYSNLGSPFFFDALIIPKDDKTAISNAIIELCRLRDAYLQALKFEGLRSITFTTSNEKYQEFVNRLNSIKVDFDG